MWETSHRNLLHRTEISVNSDFIAKELHKTGEN